MEVDEQPRRQASETEVREQLCLMYRQEPLHGFDLDDERMLDQEVQAVAARELNPLVLDGDGPLPVEVETSEAELVGQALLVRGLEQARSQRTMNFDARSDDLLRTVLESSRLPAFLLHLVLVGRLPMKLRTEKC